MARSKPCLSQHTSTMKVALAVLAVVLAAAANTAAAAELLESLYPAKFQEEGGDEARARLDGLAQARSIDVEYRARFELRGSMEPMKEGEDLIAAKSASLFDGEGGMEEARARFDVDSTLDVDEARARMDGGGGENLFDLPLP